jgi:hypothetical protein
MRRSSASLDLQTGGGEVLSQVPVLGALGVAPDHRQAENPPVQELCSTVRFMFQQRLWRVLIAFILLNAAFAAMGLLWNHPARVTAWWVTWILADVAALAASALILLDRPPRLTWDWGFAWLFICVNLAALVYVVGVAIAASRCDPGGAPEGCLVRLLIPLAAVVLVVVDLLLAALWSVGRAVRRRFAQGDS